MIEMLTDSQQDEMCDLCEDLVLGCHNMTSTFVCEGRYCDEAYEMYVETLSSRERLRITSNVPYENRCIEAGKRVAAEERERRRREEEQYLSTPPKVVRRIHLINRTQTGKYRRKLCRAS